MQVNGPQHEEGDAAPSVDASKSGSSNKAALSIYAALLGRDVRIDPDAAKPEKGVEIRFAVHSSIKLGGTCGRSHSPLRPEPTWLDHIGQWFANAVHACNRVWQRITLPKQLRTHRVEEPGEIVATSAPRTVETSVIFPSETTPNIETMVTPATTLMHRKPVIMVGPAVLKHRSQNKAHAA